MPVHNLVNLAWLFPLFFKKSSLHLPMIVVCQFMKKVESRILIVDDNHAIHEDFGNLLNPRNFNKHDAAVASLERDLFGSDQISQDISAQLSYKYVLDSAHQGQEAIQKVEAALAEERPYWLVYMDVRMPPGIDGIQTTQKLWSLCPDIQVVICSAYSDYDWEDILKALGERDNLFFIRKPFDPVAIKQSALTLSKKWELFQQGKEHTRTLEEQVRARTAELERTIVALKEQKEISDRSAKAKTVFLSNMSHEIRTPLHGIIGMTDVLCAQELKGEIREHVKTIAASSKMLLNIINEILDYSKIEAGKLVLEEAEIDLRCLVECVCDLLAPTAHEKEIELLALVDSDAPRRIIGDPLRLRQVLLNLANNAIKFSHPDGNVYIRAHTQPLENGKIRCHFSVQDHGIGMCEEQLALIFTPYVQTEKSISRRYGGTGLGLSICKRLVQLMDGQISARSAVDQGSTFEFYFDTEAVGTQTLSLVHLDDKIKQRNLFIIGDNAGHFEIIKQYVGEWSVCCQHVSEAQLRDLNIGSKDIVVVDLLKNDVSQYVSLSKSLKEKMQPNQPLGAFTRYDNRSGISMLKEHNYPVVMYRPVKYRALYAALKALVAEVDHSKSRVLNQFTVPMVSRAGLRFLVVEDNVVNQKVIAGILKPMGISVRIANNGAIALKILEESEPFDLIFMDVNMPVMDGIETTKRIRAQSKYKNLPILALTADVFNANKEECLNAGMDDFVSKPFTAKVIAAAIERFIQVDDGGA